MIKVYLYAEGDEDYQDLVALCQRHGWPCRVLPRAWGHPHLPEKCQEAILSFMDIYQNGASIHEAARRTGVKPGSGWHYLKQAGLLRHDRVGRPRKTRLHEL